MKLKIMSIGLAGLLSAGMDHAAQQPSQVSKLVKKFEGKPELAEQMAQPEQKSAVAGDAKTTVLFNQLIAMLNKNGDNENFSVMLDASQKNKESLALIELREQFIPLLSPLGYQALCVFLVEWEWGCGRSGLIGTRLELMGFMQRNLALMSKQPFKDDQERETVVATFKKEARFLKTKLEGEIILPGLSDALYELFKQLIVQKTAKK